MKIHTAARNSEQAWLFQQNLQRPFTKNLRLNLWTDTCNSMAIQSHAFALFHPKHSKSHQQGFPVMQTRILSNKPGLQGWPQQSQSETITVASKEIVYSSLLMRARVTVVFYQGRHEEFIPVCPKVLAGQESKCHKLKKIYIKMSFFDFMDKKLKIAN